MCVCVCVLLSPVWISSIMNIQYPQTLAAYISTNIRGIVFHFFVVIYDPFPPVLRLTKLTLSLLKGMLKGNRKRWNT